MAPGSATQHMRRAEFVKRRVRAGQRTVETIGKQSTRLAQAHSTSLCSLHGVERELTVAIPEGGIDSLPSSAPGPVQPSAGGGERREQKSLTQERELRARIHVITLAVSDLDAALAFYRDGLGLDSHGVIGTEFTGDDTNPAGAAAMFELEGGLILALYPRTELAKDANIPLGPPKTGEFSIGHAVASKEEVDTLLVRADEAGATLTVLGHDRPWGIYAGYFRDLDGHLWEIMWNPRLDIDRPS